MSALDTHVNMHLASYKLMKVLLGCQLDTRNLSCQLLVLTLRKIGASNRKVGKINFLCQVVNQRELSHFYDYRSNWELSTLIWRREQWSYCLWWSVLPDAMVLACFLDFSLGLIVALARDWPNVLSFSFTADFGSLTFSEATLWDSIAIVWGIFLFRALVIRTLSEPDVFTSITTKLDAVMKELKKQLNNKYYAHNH